MRPTFPRIALLASASILVASCTTTTTTKAASDTPDTAAQNACVAKLSPEATAVYRVAALDMRPNTDLPTLLRERVMMLVFTDQLDRSAARPAAEAAAVCLEQLRH